jgi:FkbM family methyltransferase
MADIIGESPAIRIVDIGANPIEGPAPYQPLLDRGLARVVGFDPHPAAVLRLNDRKGPWETYLPLAIGDGTERALYVCAAEGMTSLFEPNPEILNLFYGFPEWGTVKEVQTVKTVRLDDVPEIGEVDYLKLDIQGGELLVLENATRCLSSCLVIQLEVEFLPLYKGQPLFSEVEQFLRAQGFTIHKFWPLKSRALKPLVVGDNIRTNYGQLFWADAVFVRDLTRLHRLASAQLKTLATIAEDVYASHDLALRVTTLLDERHGTRHADQLVAAWTTAG